MNNDDWNDDDGENSVPSDDSRPNTLIVNQSSKKNKSLRRRQTIGTSQARQYASRGQHQTALKQLQSMFWPARQTHNTNVNNNQLNEHEQVPMITKKQTTTVQRSSSTRERNQNINNDNLNEQQ